MFRALVLSAAFLVSLLPTAQAADAPPPLPARWDELTTSDWDKALQASSQTCILPFGILEKHGPHSPLGTDLIKVREIAARTAKREYAVVFPDYFYGQINEARQQPGTFALPPRVVWDLLEATTDEIGRNGFKRILILNGHGGNPELIQYFMQSLLSKRRSYAVYYFNEPSPAPDAAFDEKVARMLKSDPDLDMHAGENETSRMLYLRPDLLRMDRAKDESGADQKRNPLPSDLYTPIWWYSRFPNHYSGEGDKATRALGEAVVEHVVARLAEVLKVIKADTRTLEMQNEFYDRVDKLGAGK
jgi:creatinine amidohydrolase